MATFNGSVTGGRLAFRASPSTSGTLHQYIENGTSVTVSTFTGTGSQEWFKATIGGTSGYLMARWVAITSGGNAGTIATQTDPLNIRATPSSSGTISFTVAKGGAVRILDMSSVSGWYRIGCSQGTGWGSSTYIGVSV